MADVVLLDGRGEARTYYGVTEVVLDTTTAGVKAYFQEGTLSQPTFNLDFSNGNQTISAPSGTLMPQATISQPATFISDNIKSGVTIAGIMGTYVPSNLQSKTITPTTSEQSVTADDGYDGLAEVTVYPISPIISASTYTPTTSDIVIAASQYLGGAQTILGDANLVPSNINQAVSIFGVQGTFEGGGWEKCPESWAAGLIDKTLSGSVSASMVYYLPSMCFQGCSMLTAVDFPMCETVEYLAFGYCHSLETVNLANCLVIENNAFSDCRALSYIELPKCTTIGYGAFSSCIGLTTVSAPECVIMSNNAFYKCTSLTTISLPKCINISTSAFWGCTKLSEINFPMCTYVETGAFSWCTSLASVSLPLCEAIYYSAFANCTSLSEISLPSATLIGASAFQSCTHLMSVYFLGSTVPRLDYVNAFTGTPLSDSSYTGEWGSIFVQSSMVDAFKAANNWSLYADRITAYGG